MRALAGLLALSVVGAGCGAGTSSGTMVPTAFGPPVRAPMIDETGRYGNWQVIGSSALAVTQVIADREHDAIWFADANNGLYRVDMNGVVSLYPMTYRGGSFQPYNLAVGADHRFYFGTALSISAIGAFAPSSPGHGTLSVYQLPGDDLWQGGGFALGNDGNVWFTELAHISSITPAGKITEIAYPSGANSNAFAGAVADAAGNIWFTEYIGATPPGKGIVARLVPKTGVITEFDVSKVCPTPGTITRGSGSGFFLTCGTQGPNTLAEVSATGQATGFSNPYGTAFGLNFTALGPDGAYYITPFVTKEFLVRFDPKTKAITTVRAPSWLGGFGFGPLVLGPDDNLWSVDLTGAILIDLFNIVSVKPLTIALAPSKSATLVATYHGTQQRPLSATSTDTRIATVAPGSPSGTFIATGVAKGYAEIIVRDPLGNRVTVEVTVR